MSQVSPASDRDLISMQDARERARQAKAAHARLAELSQREVDAVVDAMAHTAAAEAEALAALAVEETGYGVAADKVRKNLFAARDVHRFIRPMKTVGVIRRRDDRRVIEIAEPFGVVAAIAPSTNPTSTAIYKILIALKARCAIVVSPHPAAVRCIARTAELMARAARDAGAPDHAVGWMTTVTMEGAQELMRHRDVAVILATGGMEMVRAAYSAGKPAYGVGPGNAPAYIERSADVPKAVRDVIAGKTFDNGVLCSSENSVVVDESIAAEVTREFEAGGGYFLSPAERDAVAGALVTPRRLPNPALVGKSAQEVAQRAGLRAPPDTRVLIAPLDGVGPDHPLSIEKLCPVLSFYVVSDWRAGCDRCKEILGYGGMGHTMSIHSRNDSVILEFGLRKPAFRIVVNTPTTHGSVGMTTGLDPAMTLGCGGYGGNITSDNISPMHLLNVKRLAHEIRPAAAAAPAEKPPPPEPAAGPNAPLDGDTLAARVHEFLARRGVAGRAAAAAEPPAERRTAPAPAPAADPAPPAPPEPAPAGAAAPPPARPAGETPPPAVPFVCEDDVRQAIRQSRSIVIDERTIVTPAARDLAERHRVFAHAGLFR